jgi:F0F1-type ATP synthase delta subunit
MRGITEKRFLDNWGNSLSNLIGTDEAQLDLWVGVMDILLDIRKVRSARSFALDGRISLDDKLSFFRNVIGQTLGKPLPDTLENLLIPLLEGNLWENLPSLKEMVVRRFDERAGQVVVEIASPGELSSDVQGKILQGLEVMINSEEGAAAGISKSVPKTQSLKVRPVWKTNRSLIAGLEVRIGSRVWDNSLAARLRELERALLVRA